MSDAGDNNSSSESSLDDNLPLENFCKKQRTLNSNCEPETSSKNENKHKQENQNKRKILMKIQIEDSDDDDDDESGMDSNSERSIKASKKYSNKILGSSDDDSTDTDSEIPSNRNNIHNNAINIDDSVNIQRASKMQSSAIEENGFTSDSSNNDCHEKCPICLLTFRQQEIGNPITCEHVFCACCIEEWSKNVQTCPIDRKEFKKIVIRESYENRKVIREIFVDKPILIEDDGEVEERTHCEICQRTNREDVMLLCDACNQGYHMFCLDPPLEHVPDGYWYCDNCFDPSEDDVEDDLDALYEDIRDLGLPETRLRITQIRQPRIIRTRQSERIQENISRRRRENEINISEPSTSRALQSRIAPTALRRTTTTTTTTTTKTTRLTSKKRTKRTRRTRKRRRRTYVVEYDINNFDEKFALKTNKKYIRKRRIKRKKKKINKSKMNGNLNQRISNNRKTLAEQLGVTRLTKETRPIELRQNFSLFGGANDLEYFSADESDGGEIISSGGGPLIQTSIRIQTMRGGTLARQKGIITALDRPSTSADLLSDIMNMQDRFHNATRHDRVTSVQISSDGTLNFGDNTSSKDNSINKSENKYPVDSNDIQNAPMYPRGGTGGGFQNFGNNNDSGAYNNRYNNQANYRGGSNSGSGSASGSQYRHSTGGSGNDNFRSGNINNYQRNNQPNNNGNFTPNFRDRFNRNNQNRRNQGNRQSRQMTDSNEDLSGDNPSDQNLQSMQNQPRPLMSQDIHITDEPQSSSQQSTSANTSSDFSSKSSLTGSLGIKSTLDLASGSSLNSTLGITSTLDLSAHSRRPLPNLNLGTLSSMNPKLEMYGHRNNPVMSNMNINSGMAQTNTSISGSQLLGPPPPLHIPPPSIGMMNMNQPPPPIIQATHIIGPHMSPMSTQFGPTITSQLSSSMEAQLSQLNSGSSSHMLAFAQPPPPPPPPPVPDTLIGPAPFIGPTLPSNLTTLLPPPPPPPVATEAQASWNENLYRLSMDYGDGQDDEDENENCPNFSIYSAESLKVAKSTSDQCQTEALEKQQDEDDCDEKEEDLVQLGDDDEIPDTINSAKNDCNESDIYEPENPTEEDVVGENSMENKSLDDTEKLNNHLYESFNENKKSVLDLHDESDWEELNNESVDNAKDDEKLETKSDNENNESKEEDRSYTPLTPCLDEKNDDDDGIQTPETENLVLSDKEKNERMNVENSSGIGGMETELISEEDEDILNDENGNSKSKAIDKKKYKSSGKNKQIFKKITKNQRERNYRSDRNSPQIRLQNNNRQQRKRSRSRSRSRRRSRSRSRSRTYDKENRGGRNRKNMMSRQPKPKRRDIERYNVRNVIGQPRSYKDRYGRDTSRPPRSHSRTKSPRLPIPRSRSKSRQKYSYSKSPPTPQNRRRSSFSMSPSPAARRRSSNTSPIKRRSRSFHRSPLNRRRSRSPLRIRSRTPLRMHSRSNSGNRADDNRRIIPTKRHSASLSLSRSGSFINCSPSGPTKSRKRKRSKEGKKKKSRRRKGLRSSVSPVRRRSITQNRFTPPTNQLSPLSPEIVTRKKKAKRPPPKLPERPPSRAWSPSPDYIPASEVINEAPLHESWTPPMSPAPAQPGGLTVMIKNKEPKKKRDKKKKKDSSTGVKRDKRNKKANSPVAPSKEVFASGDNILVSVSFNKESNTTLAQPIHQQTTVVTLPPTREEIVVRRRTPEPRSRSRNKKRANKDKRNSKERDLPRRKRKKNDAKPIAIIDLDRSPFQVIQSPKDIIILTDSENEDGENNLSNSQTLQQQLQQRSDDTNSNVMDDDLHHRHHHHHLHVIQENHLKSPTERSTSSSVHKHLQNIDAYEIQGPKTPPEPPQLVKFSLSTKNKIKVRNPLHDEAEELEEKQQQLEQERLELEQQQQQLQQLELEIQQHEQAQLQLQQQQQMQAMQSEVSNKIGPNTPPDSGPCSPDVYDPFDPTKSPSQSPTSPTPLEPQNSSDKDLAISNETPKSTEKNNINTSDLMRAFMNCSSNTISQSESQSDGLIESQSINDEAINATPKIQVLSNVIINPATSSSKSQIPLISSPSSISKLSQIGPSTPLGVTKLPPNMSSNSIVTSSSMATSSKMLRHNGGSSLIDDLPLPPITFNDIESPYSPGSDDYEDLFEPPPEVSRHKSTPSKQSKHPAKATDMFDNLFGSSSPIQKFNANKRKQKSSASKFPNTKKTSVKVAKISSGGKVDDEQIKIYDDLPNSAVELQVKDKFLRKLNRQERVVEEVKLVLKPHYNKKHITKEDYKEILRRSVPKICHSRSGEINPKKIQNLIEAYVKKFRARNKLALLNTGQVSSALKCQAYLKKL